MYKFESKYFFVCGFGLENSIKLILLEPCCDIGIFRYYADIMANLICHVDPD